LEEVLRHLKPDSRVGEFGCLDGSVSFAIADYCKHVYSYDLPEVIEKCKYGASNITYHGIDLDNIFPSLVHGKYDLIIAMDVVEHLQNDIAFLVACVHNMYMNSRIIISAPISEDGRVHQDPSRQTHFREYSEVQFGEILENAGIKIIDYLIENNMIYIVGEKA
jgi:2-polyprenyl-3-methyl-5-hydroxy-6-metoxy-1,4-benzoquinol methylase